MNFPSLGWSAAIRLVILLPGLLNFLPGENEPQTYISPGAPAGVWYGVKLGNAGRRRDGINGGGGAPAGANSI